jgi:ATP synthase regulation protein NCA2
MMNALNAMDEMMSANDINMNLAAITPVFIVGYFFTRVSQFLYYALLKLGKSREETFANFRNILTDIDRLLVMRDNPPLPPGQPDDGRYTNKSCVLGRDDLGMLMLLIHECRTIMWRDRRRFSSEVILSVSEDLAELAGERGKVEFHFFFSVRELTNY